MGTIVSVAEVRGRRANVVDPVSGWTSITGGSGALILERLDDDEDDGVMERTWKIYQKVFDGNKEGYVTFVHNDGTLDIAWDDDTCGSKVPPETLCDVRDGTFRSKTPQREGIQLLRGSLVDGNKEVSVD